MNDTITISWSYGVFIVFVSTAVGIFLGYISGEAQTIKKIRIYNRILNATKRASEAKGASAS